MDMGSLSIIFLTGYFVKVIAIKLQENTVSLSTKLAPLRSWIFKKSTILYKPENSLKILGNNRDFDQN